MMKILSFATAASSLTTLFIFLTATLSVAQDKPIAEATGSYQFDHLSLSADGATGNLNLSRGWDGSVNVPVLRWLGVVGDVGRVWKTESALIGAANTSVSVSATASVYTYGGGPQLTYRNRYVHPFARCIFGDAHSSIFASVASTVGNVSAGASVDSFFVAPGGGADFRITHDVWLRGGADYLRTNKYGATVNGVRAFAGITFTFGGAGTSSGQRPERAQLPAQPVRAVGLKIDSLGIKVAQARGQGAEITEVTTNSIAARAGLHVGDVINTANGKPVRTPAELAAELSGATPGAALRLGYSLRGSWQTETTVTMP
ncbi:MAG: PDZ domain-containing protein [Candidatus Sulfotelmatobacter sp.]